MSLSKQKNRKWFFAIIILIIIPLLNGCFFYKVHSTKKLVQQDFSEFSKKSKTFILHTGQHVWQMTDVRFEHDSITARLDTLIGHDKYKTTKKNRTNRYKTTKKESGVIHEVHLYTSLAFDRPQVLSIPIKDINNIEIYQIDLATTIATSILATIGISSAVVGVAFIIIILTKSSCPFVYISDGEKYKLCGEIYSGAIHVPLERHDYLPLHGIKADSGFYTIKISNEVKEIQNTNLAELWVFDYDANIQVLVDKYGQAQSMTREGFPYSATDLSGKAITSILQNEDTLNYPENIMSDSESITDGIVLDAIIPEGAKNVKLKINAKNSFFLDYAFGKFYDKFGIVYNDWQKRQDTASCEELLKWGLDQHIPLSVYVMKQNKWIFVDYFNVIGPMALKNDVLLLKLDSLTDKPLKIKLEFGLNFWQIDQIALDFSENVPIRKTIVSAAEAVDEKGMDVKTLILKEDSLYYRQPDVGNYSILRFSTPLNSSPRRSIVLHSKGHYRILRNPSGIPDRKYLESFKTPGRFNQFATELINSTKNNTQK